MFRNAPTPIPAQVRLVAYLLGGTAVMLELVALFVFSHVNVDASARAESGSPGVCYPASRGPVISLPSLELAL